MIKLIWFIKFYLSNPCDLVIVTVKSLLKSVNCTVSFNYVVHLFRPVGSKKRSFNCHSDSVSPISRCSIPLKALSFFSGIIERDNSGLPNFTLKYAELLNIDVIIRGSSSHDKVPLLKQPPLISPELC